MDMQKTIVKVLELFRTLAILYGLSWIVFGVTAFYYINNQAPEEPIAMDCVVVSGDSGMNGILSSIGTKGEVLFKNNCAQCHAATKEQIVGPGLQGIGDRRDVRWLREWIRNPQKVMGNDDKYAIDLYNRYNRTPMTAFPNFTDADIDAILTYIKEVNQ